MLAETPSDFIQRLRADDAAAAKAFFEKYKTAVSNKLFQSGIQLVEDRKDLMQEIYITTLRLLCASEFQTPERWESLHAFVSKVTRNKIHEWQRRCGVERKYFSKGEIPDGVASATEEHILEDEELSRLLQKLLRRLPKRYREVLVLIYLEEQSVAETSRALGLPPQKVSAYKNYALKLLRRELERKRKFHSIFDFLGALIYVTMELSCRAN